jgi:hypothetical protein
MPAKEKGKESSVTFEPHEWNDDSNPAVLEIQQFV